jgi:hypothetical protein
MASPMRPHMVRHRFRMLRTLYASSSKNRFIPYFWLLFALVSRSWAWVLFLGLGVLVLGLGLAFKVAQKAYRGKGGRLVSKGDLVLTDCNVTGTDVGTPDKPKFSLRMLWEYCLLPSLDALVAPGGQCEGATVVHQEDNAGTNVFLEPNTYPTPINIFLIC